jgi:DNA-binding NarL/FixJ family response regulator
MLYLPDDATVIQLEVDLTPAQLAAAVNAGMRPVPLLKKAPPGSLAAIRAGGTVIDTPGDKKFAHAGKPKISRRQVQVFELSVHGLSSGEIALLLHLSIRTVNHHLNRVKELMRSGSLTVSASAGSIDQTQRR